MKFIKLPCLFILTFSIGFGFTLPLKWCKTETTQIVTHIKPKKLAVTERTCDTDYSFYSNADGIDDLCKNYYANSSAKSDVAGESSSQNPEQEFEPEIVGIKELNDFDEPSYKIKLVDLGEINNFRKDEVVAKTGETWLGLFEENGKYYLRNTKVKIKPEDRPDYGYEDSVTIKFENRKSEPMFMLKNANKLKPGEIKALYRRPSYEEAEKRGIELKSLESGYIQKIKFGKKHYAFEVKKGRTDENRNVLVLILDDGQTSQTVEFSGYFGAGDNIGDILWAGDIDRDGKLDFYIDYYNYEKGGSSTGLYLSSEAEKGKLVKLVASFGTAGC